MASVRVLPFCAPLPCALLPDAPLPLQPFVWVAPVRSPPLAGQIFRKVQLSSCGDVADLTERMCKEFPRWGADAGQVQLFLVAAPVGVDEPSAGALEGALCGARLQSSWPLAHAGIVPGSWLLARILPDTAAAAADAAAGGGSGSPRARFHALLSEAGVTVDDRIMSTIARKGSLSSRVMLIQSVPDALELYEAASRVPRTETRARVQRELNVTIDGSMAIPGVSTALFFHAFQGCVPRVLKVPAGAGAAARECAMWLAVKDDVPEGIFLAPVQLLPLSRDSAHVVHISPGVEEATPLSAGILMPAYAATLGAVPPPADAQYAARVIGRAEPALRFLHSRGWLHGDVKPSNIFLDHFGESWLGDYGSSVQLIDIERKFTGGTLAFQCSDVLAAHEPLRFDLIVLAVSSIGKIFVLERDAGHQWRLQADIGHCPARKVTQRCQDGE